MVFLALVAVHAYSSAPMVDGPPSKRSVRSLRHRSALVLNTTNATHRQAANMLLDGKFVGSPHQRQSMHHSTCACAVAWCPNQQPHIDDKIARNLQGQALQSSKNCIPNPSKSNQC
eukprot:1176344-Amphidinium_carterae.1